MANKQYKSIIRLFDHCGIAVGEDFSMSRAKKQLQAEFRVARDGLIEIDGLVYSQHEVLEEMDNAGFPRRLIFHQQIWESADLLLLLEKNTVDFSTIREAFKPFWSNKEFDEFFSPWFAGPFSYLSRTLLAAHNLLDMGNLLSYEDFLQPAEREEAYRPVRIFLDENLRILRNVNKENYKIMRPKIAHWIDGEWFAFFNLLPDEFYDLKMELVTKLINLGVDIQKRQRRDCRKLSTQMVSLMELPENISSIIISNHEAYNRARPLLNVKGGWWVIWVVIIFIKAVTGKGCEDTSPRFRIDPQEFRLDDSVLKKFRDPGFKVDTGSIIIRSSL